MMLSQYIKQAIYDFFHTIQNIKSLIPPKPPVHGEKEKKECMRKAVQQVQAQDND